MFLAGLLAAWFVLPSAHFELVTDVPESQARPVLANLEQIYAAIGGPLRVPLPVRCVLFRRQEEFALFRPTPITRAFFQSGPDRDFIVSGLEDGKVNRAALFHEFTHLVLHHSTPRLPKWADEGLAEYYSTMEFVDGGARLGAAPDGHLRILGSAARMTAGEMAAVDQDSLAYFDPALARRFYAQSWAAAHAYETARRGEFPTGADDFSATRLESYLAGVPAPTGRLPSILIPVPAPSVAVNDAKPLSDAETAALQADLLLRLGRRDAALVLLRQWEQRLPDSAVLQSTFALAAAERGDLAEARNRFERAIRSTGADADTRFEYAVFLENSNEGAKAADLLKQALQLNPNHAEAQYLTGRELARLGRHAEALPYLEKALAILPRQPLFEAALEASREALRPVRGTDSTVRTPESWTAPVGDRKLRGRLERVDCSPAGATLTVKPDGAGRSEAFVLRGSDRVTINGVAGAKRDLACGSQYPPVPVELSVDTKAGDAKTGQARVVALTFLAP